MDLKKTNYFDPRKMAARKRWTVQETGQGLIAMTGYAYLGDEEKTALFSGADLEARIRQASAEKPRETELYLRLSNWLVIRRRETLQLKSHAMQVLQLIWRGLFVDMAQQVIAASELKDERLSARRQAVAETLSLSDEQLKEGVDILRQNFSTIAAFNVLMTLLSDTYQIDTFGYVIDADDELVMYEEARTLDELSGHRAGLFDLAEIAVTRDRLDDARAILEGGYTFPMADTRLLDSHLRPDCRAAGDHRAGRIQRRSAQPPRPVLSHGAGRGDQPSGDDGDAEHGHQPDYRRRGHRGRGIPRVF